MPIAELDDITLTCKVSPLTRSSIVACLRKIAIPYGKVSGTRNYRHSGGKNETKRLLSPCQCENANYLSMTLPHLALRQVHFPKLQMMREKGYYCPAKKLQGLRHEGVVENSLCIVQSPLYEDVKRRVKAPDRM